MKPLYKVGDRVLVKKYREGSVSDYRFGFGIEMILEHGGEIRTIKDMRPARESILGKHPLPDDGYQYSLLEDNVHYMWASSMFEPEF